MAQFTSALLKSVMRARTDKTQNRDIDNHISYDRYQGLMTNRIACFIVLGVLVFQVFQARSEESPMPVWFMPAMLALIAGVLGLLIWNFLKVKDFHNAQAIAREAEKKHSSDPAAE